MKTITLDKMVEITSNMFDAYVEPVALSFMSGEVPTTTFMIHRTGTKENDWLSHIRFKNTLTISVFRCEVFLEDIMNLCRRCKMYLVTEEVFRVAVTYSMLHPLYQTQYMDFKNDVNTDYESMMSGAAKATYTFMLQHFKFVDKFERTVLEILRYYSMVFINNFKNAPKFVRVGDRLEDLKADYDLYMKQHYPLAFKTAIRWKAQTNLVAMDGFIKLEPKTEGRVHYVGKEQEAFTAKHVREKRDETVQRTSVPDGQTRGGISNGSAESYKLVPRNYDKSPVHPHGKHSGSRIPTGEDRV